MTATIKPQGIYHYLHGFWHLAEDLCIFVLIPCAAPASRLELGPIFPLIQPKSESSHIPFLSVPRASILEAAVSFAA